MTFPSFYNTVPLENVSSNDVVIGRGRRIREHPGNVRFQSIIQANLDGYSSAVTKTKKSLIILKILNEVRSLENANFVKLDNKTGQPIEVEESAARITIAQALRDCLNQHYKSSRQHKQRKRLQIKRATATAHYINTTMARQQNNGAGASLFNLNNSLSQMMQQAHSSNTTTAIHPQALPSLVSSSAFSGSRSTSPASFSTCSSSSSSSGSSSGINDIVNEALMAAQQCRAASASSSSALPAAAPQHEEEADQEVMMDDLFTSLFKAFSPSEPSSGSASSPFEPTPLATNTSPITTTPEDTSSSSLREMMMAMEPTPLSEETSSYGSLEDDWEPFPLFA